MIISEHKASVEIDHSFPPRTHGVLLATLYKTLISLVSIQENLLSRTRSSYSSRHHLSLHASSTAIRLSAWRDERLTRWAVNSLLALLNNAAQNYLLAA